MKVIIGAEKIGELLPSRVLGSGIKAAIVTDMSRDPSLSEERMILGDTCRNRQNRHGIGIMFDDGWNGSFHDPWFWPAHDRVIVVAYSRRAGWLGRLRKTAKAVNEYWRTTGAAVILETGKTIAIRKGVYREEGD